MSWRRSVYRAARPLLFTFDPERAHDLVLRSLAISGRSALGQRLCRAVSGVPASDVSGPSIEVIGLRFRNPVGLGAGFDKDGVAIRGWAALGFGFIELGTVTPRPQPGNPRPRLVRLVADEALVNRMGFNNAGADALAERIADARPHLPAGFVIGVNIGRNRDGDADDYPAAARAVRDVADYLAVNVSSPNTPGIRDLQDPARLGDLLDAVAGAAPGRPLLVKLAPDLSPGARSGLIERIASSPAAGVIISNTALERPGLSSPAARNEVGGLSGRPLLSGTLDAVRAAQGGRLAIVGSGGIGYGRDTRRVLDAGADLVQLWTGMIYGGPGLIGEAVAAC